MEASIFFPLPSTLHPFWALKVSTLRGLLTASSIKGRIKVETIRKRTNIMIAAPRVFSNENQTATCACTRGAEELRNGGGPLGRVVAETGRKSSFFFFFFNKATVKGRG